MLPIGKVHTFFSPIWVYLGWLVVFEVGSTVCGTAPNSIAMIISRAVAGFGNAVQGLVVIVVYVVPLQH